MGSTIYACLQAGQDQHRRLFDCENKDIYIMVLKQGTHVFEIAIPRPPNDELPAHDFINAAYIRHLLSEVSIVFGYFFPKPTSDEAFCFKVQTDNLEKFTDVLYLIAQGFNTDRETAMILR